MCDKCVEIDARIATYQRIASRITDQPTIDGAKRLIAELQAKKAALHPDAGDHPSKSDTGST
jgi:hypothetical protein